jgi:hypothetical protein
MSDIKLDCYGSFELDDADIAWLDDLPDAANEMEKRRYCELSAGHDGRHVALAQAQDSNDGETLVSWWVRWPETGGKYEITAGPICGVRVDAQDEDSDLCCLPDGHPSRHMFT